MFVQPNKRRLDGQCLCSQTNAVWTANVCTMFGTAMFGQPNKSRLDGQCLYSIWLNVNQTIAAIGTFVPSLSNEKSIHT
jgi:hypothetical protein